MTRIKICGLTRPQDVQLCARLGVDMVGFILAPSPRQVTVERAAELRRLLPSHIAAVGVLLDERPDIAEVIRTVGLDYIQLHGNQSEVYAGQVGASRVIRALRVRDADSLKALRRPLEAAMLLLDTWRAGKAGGTGQPWDWSLLQDCPQPGKPVIISGGLGPDNVGALVSLYHPDAVDASSRLESAPGIKDPELMERFVAHVRPAHRIA